MSPAPTPHGPAGRPVLSPARAARPPEPGARKPEPTDLARSPEMDEALRRLGEDPVSSLEEHERAVIGTDHWAAGAFLARHWQLPAIIGASIERFGDHDEPRDGRQTIHLVRAARAWLTGLVAGGDAPLHVFGVDEAYCARRSTEYADRYEALRVMARSMT